MRLFSHIVIMGAVLCLATEAFAYPDRNSIVDQALDRMEGRLKRVVIYEDAILAESPPTSSPIKHRVDSPIREIKFNGDKPFSTSIEFGTETFFHRYKEPGIMEQDGFLYGVNAAATLRASFGGEVASVSEHFGDRDKLNIFRFEGMAAFGTVDFDSDDAGTHNGRENFMYELRGLAGYEFPVSDSLVLTPYLGIGYRYLRDKSPGRVLPFSSFSGVFSFERESTYFYLPFGLITSKEFDRGWEMDLTMEYDLLIKGEQTNHYDDGGLKVRNIEGNMFVLDAMEFDQDKGFGLRGSARLMNKSKRFSYFIEPYVRFWKVRDSETRRFTSNTRIHWYDSTGTIPREGNQPKNETLEAGLKMGLKY